MTTDIGTLLEGKVTAWLQGHAEDARQARPLIALVITGDGGGAWTLDGEAEPPAFRRGAAANAKTTVELSAQTFQQLLAKEITPEQSFLSGEIKISGDFSLALWLGDILG